tara:strand:- start:514 stop:1269 length:756 start_codon:yes stop_codon:yes gene_type:complete
MQLTVDSSIDEVWDSQPEERKEIGQNHWLVRELRHSGLDQPSFSKGHSEEDWTEYSAVFQGAMLQQFYKEIEESKMTESRKQLLQMIPPVPDQHDDWDKAALNFEPSELSEIVEDLFITSRDGVEAAMMEGQFIINVTQKGELDTHYDAQISLYPDERTNMIRLKTLALLIDELIQAGRPVAVHCSMGMERSVLAVAYYLHTKMDKTLDEAYALIMERRPIALDRRSWACPLDHWHSNESQEDCTLGGSDV